MNQKKNDIIIFLASTFLLTFLAGFYFYFNKNNFNANFLGAVIMLFPATSVGITKIITNKNKNLPYLFYGIYFAMILFYMVYIYLIKNQIIDEIIGGQILSIAILIGSILLFLVDNKKLSINNLEFKKNLKTSILLNLLFVALIIIQILIRHQSIIFNIKSVVSFLISPIIVLLTLVNFFGQEFGFRYFLQGRLQKIFGKKLGVIILGLIWGIFYIIPFYLMYDFDNFKFIILERIISCIFLSIFMGYVYMKTENIWAVTWIHGLNNQLLVILSPSVLVHSEKDFILLVLSMCIVFLPFLFTKEYNSKDIIIN